MLLIWTQTISQGRPHSRLTLRWTGSEYATYYNWTEQWEIEDESAERELQLQYHDSINHCILIRKMHTRLYIIGFWAHWQYMKYLLKYPFICSDLPDNLFLEVNGINNSIIKACEEYIFSQISPILLILDEGTWPRRPPYPNWHTDPYTRN